MEDLKTEILKLKVTISVVLMVFFCFFGISSVIFFAVYTQKTLVEGHHQEEKVAESKKADEKRDRFEGDKMKAQVLGNSEYVDKEDSKEFFQDVDIKAKSVLVWDIKEGEAIYEKFPQKPLPLASLAKLMTAVVALEEADPKLPVIIDHDSLMQYGNSGLLLNEKWSLKKLAGVSIMSSINDASYAMARTVGSRLVGDSSREGVEMFVSRMNEKSEEIGLSNTFFNNSTGLDINKKTAGAYGSARDIVKLTLHVLSEYPGVLYSTRHPSKEVVSLSGFRHTFLNTNPIVSDVEGVVASKTGYTDLAGGNLMVVVNADFNYPVVIVVLGSTFDGRFKDVRILTEETRNYLSSL
ncbi:MAG: D-alanyl-D-alanine carboxypeptidase family protein [Patescibacteria group bacterium]